MKDFFGGFNVFKRNTTAYTMVWFWKISLYLKFCCMAVIDIVLLSIHINHINPAIFVCLSQNLDFHCHVVVFFAFSVLRWEVIVPFFLYRWNCWSSLLTLFSYSKTYTWGRRALVLILITFLDTGNFNDSEYMK